MSAEPVETWRQTELPFAAARNYDAGGGDAVRFDVTFSNRTTGAVLVRPGFWDGGSRFLVRFAPTAPGVWDWRSTSDDAGLAGRSGEVEATPYDGPLALYRHGFVKTVPGKKHLVHADGTPFFYLGDTHWGMLTEEIDVPGPHAGKTGAKSHFKYIVDRRVAQGFTVYQSEPLGSKFDLRDGRVDASDIEGFRLADRYYRHIADAGLLHANASLLFPFWMSVDLATNTVALARLSRYWVARFGAYPVLWTLGQEVDNDYYAEHGKHPHWDFSNNPWITVAEAMHVADAYGHPLSAHQEGTEYTTVTGKGTSTKVKISGKGVSIFLSEAVSARTGHNWWAAQWKPSLAKPQETETPRDYWRSPKPAVNYESRYCGLWTKDFGARAQGWISFLSGFCGYGYGAIDIWLYRSNYDVDKISKDGVDTITPDDKKRHWCESVEYPSALQMAHLKAFLTSFDWWNLKPAFEDVTSGDNRDVFGVHAVAGRRHVCYFYGKDRRTFVLKGLEKASPCALGWFNPRTGERLPEIFVQTDADGRLALPACPDDQDWAVEIVPRR